MHTNEFIYDWLLISLLIGAIWNVDPIVDVIKWFRPGVRIIGEGSHVHDLLWSHPKLSFWSWASLVGPFDQPQTSAPESLLLIMELGLWWSHWNRPPLHSSSLSWCIRTGPRLRDEVKDALSGSMRTEEHAH